MSLLLARGSGRFGRATLELHERQRRPDRRAVARLLEAFGTSVLDRTSALLDICKESGELVPALLVEHHGVPADVHVLAVEATSLGCATEVLGDLAEYAVRQRAPERRRQLRPVVAADLWQLERLVVVLDRSAARLGAHQLDHFQVSQEAHVVADVAQRLPELVGELARAGHLLVEQRE